MRRLACCVAAAAVVAASSAFGQSPSASPTMPSFSSDEALIGFLMPDGKLLAASSPLAPSAPPPPPPPPSISGATSSAASPPPNPSITNTQIAGVDEGGIVKVSGDHLVVLRRGRLFSVSTANGALKPVDTIDASPPGVDASGDWYDEMLVRGDLVVVVGYSYRRGGAEINRFRIDTEGRFTFVDAYHLKANDYYSSSNYASRLIDNTLILYTPLSFGWGKTDPLQLLPGLSRWHPGQEKAAFRRITGPRQIFVPEPILKGGAELVETMHTVHRCDLTAVELSCEATVVLGPEGRTFFVSQNAVYVWVSPNWSGLIDYNSDDANASYDREMFKPGMLYRIPFAPGAPSAVGVRGTPLDQFSFHPNVAQSRLDILVTSTEEGDEMWNPVFANYRPALLRLPTTRFGDGSEEALLSDYQMMPEHGRLTQNRFVNGHLMYAMQDYGAARSSLFVAPVDGGESTRLSLDAPATRLEVLGRDGLVITSGSDVAFTTVEFEGSKPRLGSQYVEPAAREGESRSQAFFYRADDAQGRSGLLGLPIFYNLRGGIDGAAWRPSAAMLYLQRQERELSDFGRLNADPDATSTGDECQASCTDWYGNARPIFLGDRVFALMGYEIIEGDDDGNRMEEVRRVSFAPSGHTD
jgi:hypothetical protein